MKRKQFLTGLFGIATIPILSAANDDNFQIERDSESYPLEGVIEFTPNSIILIPARRMPYDEYNKFQEELDKKLHSFLSYKKEDPKLLH